MIKDWKLFIEKYETDDSDWEMEPSEEDLEDILDETDIDLEIENLCSMIRKYLKGSDLDTSVSYQDNEITIAVFLGKKESVKSLRETLETLKKLQKDILPEYESDVQIYVDKGTPILYLDLSLDNEGDGDTDKNKHF